MFYWCRIDDTLNIYRDLKDSREVTTVEFTSHGYAVARALFQREDGKLVQYRTIPREYVDSKAGTKKLIVSVRAFVTERNRGLLPRFHMEYGPMKL